VAWEIYWGCRSLDHRLAAEAAATIAEHEEDPREELEWLINEAQHRAHIGDAAPLESLRARAGEQAQAWAHLSWAYSDLKRYPEANEAAQRAFSLDPEDRLALTVMEETHVRLNRPEEALRCAFRLKELHPYEHQGPERLGILLAKLFRVEEALQFSMQAVDAAPFCHISHRSRAVALFMAGQHELAEQHARQALSLEEPEEEDAGDDSLIVLRALSGDVDGLQRCLESLEQEEPPEIFAEFKQHLREVALQRIS
jgi:tetratricopeptide (TPR) repeat protein